MSKKTKQAAVALWNAIAAYEQSGGTRTGYASDKVQRMTWKVLDLCSEWSFTTVPQTVWSAVVRDLRRQTERKHGLPWSWCLEVARCLLWMMDADYMIRGLPVIEVGKGLKSTRVAAVVTAHGVARTVPKGIRSTTEDALRAFKNKGHFDFRVRQYLKRFLEDLPELAMYLENVPGKARVIRRVSLGIRERIYFT